MTAPELIARLRGLGMSVRGEGGALVFEAATEPPAEVLALVEELKRLKPEALACLKAAEPVWQGGPAPQRLDSTLPAEWSRDLAEWPLERQGLWRRRLARIQAETGWLLGKAERAAYWDVKWWGDFLDPGQRPRTVREGQG